jgi:6-phosphogluconate dehydrogenase (decarboxylating)
MQLGMIGLGRMGTNMVRRLIRKGHECVVYSSAGNYSATGVREENRRTKSARARMKL